MVVVGSDFDVEIDFSAFLVIDNFAQGNNAYHSVQFIGFRKTALSVLKYIPCNLFRITGFCKFRDKQYFEI